MKVRANKGFTLIELLVVIAIIGMLAAIIIANVANARTRGADARRIQDIRQLQTAIELYYQTCGVYPSTLSNLKDIQCTDPNGNTITLSPAMSNPTLTDPNGVAYNYVAYSPVAGVATCSGGYHLGIPLQNTPGQAPSNDANYYLPAWQCGATDFNGASAGCGGGGPGWCYDVGVAPCKAIPNSC